MLKPLLTPNLLEYTDNELTNKPSNQMTSPQIIIDPTARESWNEN